MVYNICSLYFLAGYRTGGLCHSKWEVVCFNVEDWERLAESLDGEESLAEEALRRLITDNFLPNLPKIVEDMVGYVLCAMKGFFMKRSYFIPKNECLILKAKP